MESFTANAAQTAAVLHNEVVDDLPQWKLDSTFQHRVNNVCTKLLRKGVRPTYQRLRANMGKSPARLLREALQNWTVTVLPDLYTAPKIEWADRPKAISPRVAELFEEMWLQAVSAAQVHYELGDTSGAQLTHHELVETVILELRRVNTRLSSVADSVRCLDQVMTLQKESMRDLRGGIEDSLRVLELEIASAQDLRRSLDDALLALKRESKQQTVLLSQHVEACEEIQRLERARLARIRRLSATLGRGKQASSGRLTKARRARV